MKKLILLTLMAGLSFATSALAADKNHDVPGIYVGNTETLEWGSRPRPRPPMMVGEIVFEFGSRPRPLRPPQALQ